MHFLPRLRSLLSIARSPDPHCSASIPANQIGKSTAYTLPKLEASEGKKPKYYNSLSALTFANERRMHNATSSSARMMRNPLPCITCPACLSIRWAMRPQARAVQCFSPPVLPGRPRDATITKPTFLSCHRTLAELQCYARPVEAGTPKTRARRVYRATASAASSRAGNRTVHCSYHPTMAKALSALAALANLLPFVAANALITRASDPCAAIAGQKWVAPKDVRACFTSFAVDPDLKSNVGACVLPASIELTRNLLKMDSDH